VIDQRRRKEHEALHSHHFTEVEGQWLGLKRRRVQGMG
jgi:hypothetical protein